VAAILDGIPELVTSSARISVFWEEGVFLPGNTLPIFTGVLTLSGVISRPLRAVIPAIALSAAPGDPLGYTLGRTTGRRTFERRDLALISSSSVTRTQVFFELSTAVGFFTALLLGQTGHKARIRTGP
jgi:membrane protein DedA with SNARE-associated domain